VVEVVIRAGIFGPPWSTITPRYLPFLSVMLVLWRSNDVLVHIAEAPNQALTRSFVPKFPAAPARSHLPSSAAA
jgi:hypothetical protein